VQLFSDIQKDEQREGRKDNVYPWKNHVLGLCPSSDVS
jgi:hypothetical protein